MMPYGGYGYGSYQTSQAGDYGLDTYSAPAPGNKIVIENVALYDNSVRPSTITVAPGTTVQWRNSGEHTHTVTSNSKGWDSGELYPGEVFSYTFNRPGTFAYHCTLHANEMRGVVVVKGEANRQGSYSLSSTLARIPRVPTADDIEVSGPMNTPPPHRGIIRLLLPRTWVDVSINDRKIDSVGKTRTYVTPELPQARTFEVTATWKQNGRTNRVEDSVTMKAGQVRTLDFRSARHTD
jgi:uncharacterized protein (TIGR03000 family)